MQQSSSGGASANARENLKGVLSHALEEELALSGTLRAVLARVAGPGAQSLWRLIGDHRRELDEWLSEITRRARAVGIVTRTGATEVVRSARATVGLAPAVPSRNLIGELLAQHEAIAARLRDDLETCAADPGTNELLTGLVDFHETTAWMLRILLDGPDVPRSQR